MDQYLIDALKIKYEHPDIIAAIDTQVEIYANAKEKLEVLNEF